MNTPIILTPRKLTANAKGWEKYCVRHAIAYVAFIKKNNKKPTSYPNNTKETELANWFCQYKSRINGKKLSKQLYESVTNYLIQELGNDIFNKINYEEESIEKAKEYVEFIHKTNSRPKYNSEDPKERQLFSWFVGYKYSVQNPINSEYYKTYESVTNYLKEQVGPNCLDSCFDILFDNAKLYVAWVKTNNRKPTYYKVTDQEEIELNGHLIRVTAITEHNNCPEPELPKELRYILKRHSYCVKAITVNSKACFEIGLEDAIGRGDIFALLLSNDPSNLTAHYIPLNNFNSEYFLKFSNRD